MENIHIKMNNLTELWLSFIYYCCWTKYNQNRGRNTSPRWIECLLRKSWSLPLYTAKRISTKLSTRFAKGGRLLCLLFCSLIWMIWHPFQSVVSFSTMQVTASKWRSSSSDLSLVIPTQHQRKIQLQPTRTRSRKEKEAQPARGEHAAPMEMISRNHNEDPRPNK